LEPEVRCLRKIVLLHGNEITEEMYRKDQLDKIREMGEVSVNTQVGPPSQAQVAEMIEGAEVAFTSWGCPPLDKSVLDRAPGLKVILHAAGTVKGIVTPEVIARGIRVSSANDAIGQGVAETTLGLTIVSLKNIWQLANFTKDGEWAKGKAFVKDFYGVTIGIIGAGKAGRHYIRLLQSFNVQILVYDPLLTDEQAAEMGVVRVDLHKLMSESDVVSIHAPSLPETYKMINTNSLRWMKDNAVLINTARGDIIDEEALVAELRSGRIWACLDVTDPEPPCDDHPFRTLPNVILTPHIAGVVTNGLNRVTDYAIRDLELFLEGRLMNGEVDLQSLNVIA
jgi:phosphoglycerate dehydrogenase-like enzyme